MFKKAFILLQLFSLLSGAQVLLPTPETAFEKQHNFNADIIKRRGIQKITFEILDKKDFEVAVDKNLVETYEFNREGLLTRYYYTNLVKTIDKVISFDRPVKSKGRSRTHAVSQQTISQYVYDTISTCFFYSGKNLVLKRYHDGGLYYESRYYRYDADGNLTRELRFKETNNSPDKSLFILGNQLQLSEDSFQYNRFKSGQVKCISLNNENRSYKEKITDCDSLGRKILVSEYFTAAAWIRQESRFEYSGNKLTSAGFTGNAGNEVTLKNTYEYDTASELYAEKQFKNNVLIKEINYVTDRNNGLLNSLIIRDPAAKSLRIIKLKYDFGWLGKGN